MKMLIVLPLVLLCGLAGAEEYFYGWHPSSVDIGGQHVLTFRAGSGKMTAADRRAMLEFRMIKSLTHTEWLKAVTMTYKRVPAGMAICANGVYFVCVTPDDAKANKSTIRSLAKQWGDSIKRTFEIVGPSRQLPHTAAAHPKEPISLD